LPFLSLQNVSVDMGSFTDPEVIPWPARHFFKDQKKRKSN
jgi:hypothetical protein